MNLETIQTITLDLTVHKIKNVHCVEDDQQSRIINVLVTNNGEAYPLDSATMVARYKIHKPDHTYIYNNAAINEDGTVTITLPDQAMTVPGILHSALQISKNEKIISTMPFNIIVEKSVFGNKDLESQNESDVLNDMISHLSDFDNPHQTTKAQVGLGNADNTSDADKPVSIVQQAALDKKLDKTTVATSSTLGLIKSGTDITIDSSGNVSVNDNSHNHIMSNISDITATANEINVLDGITANTIELNYLNGVTSNIQTQLNAKAPLESPILTGNPTAPTASPSTNNTQIATTAFTQTAVNNHNTSSIAHDDIRQLITGLTNRLNALADSDDTTLDQLSEIVAYIKNNKSLIDNITTSKVNVSDIIDNLTSTATNKPLSANQGKILKDLIDMLTASVDNKVDKVSGKGLSTNDYTTAEKNKLNGIASGAEVNTQSDWNITDSASDAYIKNKPTIPTKTSQLVNDSGFTDNYTHPDIDTTAKSNGLYKIATDENGHVTEASSVSKEDITALGIPEADTWRGIQNNLTSDSTEDSLSAAQGKLLKSLVDGKADNNHSHNYLPLSGGTVSGTINSSVVSSTYLGANNGRVIINSTDGAGGFAMLDKLNSTNGYFTDGVYQSKRVFNYTARSTVNAGTNGFSSSITLLDESGGTLLNSLGIYGNTQTRAVYPETNNAYSLGTSAKRYSTIYAWTTDTVQVRTQHCYTYTLSNGGNKNPGSSLYHPIVTVPGNDNRAVNYINSNSGTPYSVTINGQWGASSYASHNITSASSDIRLKENICYTEENGLEMINRIKIRQFDWKDGGAHQKIGFIADELEDIDKHFAFGGGYEEDGSMNVKSVDTFYMMGYVVKGMQELSAWKTKAEKQIIDLKKENEELKNRILNLESKIS